MAKEEFAAVARARAGSGIVAEMLLFKSSNRLEIESYIESSGEASDAKDAVSLLKVFYSKNFCLNVIVAVEMK